MWYLSEPSLVPAMKTLSIWNNKGGCGKTTLAVHLAYWAEKTRRRCLLVDMDRQGNALQWIAGDEAQDLRPGAVLERSHYLSLLYSPDGPALNLPPFDVVVVDCPPGLDVADRLTPDLWIVPVDSSFAVRGAANVHADLSPSGVPLLFVLNRADAGGLRVQKGIADALASGDLDVWPDAIPENAALTRAASYGVAVWDAPFASKNVNSIVERFAEGVFTRLGVAAPRASKRSAS